MPIDNSPAPSSPGYPLSSSTSRTSRIGNSGSGSAPVASCANDSEFEWGVHEFFHPGNGHLMELKS